MPPGGAGPRGVGGAPVRRVAASGTGPAAPTPRSRRVSGANQRKRSGPRDHSDDDGDVDDGNGMLSSIVGLMEQGSELQSAGSIGLDPPASPHGLRQASRFEHVAELAMQVQQLGTNYAFLEPSFEHTTRRASMAAAASSSTFDFMSRAGSSETTFSTGSSAPSPAKASSSSAPPANNDDPEIDEGVRQSYAHLTRMPHDELLRYAMRLTTIVSAFMNRERQRVKARHGPDSDSDENDTAANSHTSAPTSGYGVAASPDLTASIRSMRLPPVVHTNQVQMATDFEGNKTINEYSMIAELGRGAYGKVKLAVSNTTNETCAIKIMKKSVLKRGTGEMVVKREIAVMKKLRHQNIVPLIEVLDDPEADKIYLVMKYIDNGTIVKVKPDLTCNTLPLDTAARYLRQLISGLTYLHKHGVIHRDLKPDNVMLDQHGTVYLTDFGVSEIVASESGAISGTEGTPVFLAPELLVDNATSSKGGSKAVRGPPVDVWALGVTFYFAVFGVAPFRGTSWVSIADNVVNAPLKFPDGADKQWVDVLSKLLVKDPAKRMTLSQLKRHPLFDAINAERAAAGDGNALDLTSPNMSVNQYLNGTETEPIEVTEAEVHGSMRIVNSKAINEDENFKHVSDGAKRRVGSFVGRLRHRLAEKRLASLGDIVHDSSDARTSTAGSVGLTSVEATPELKPSASPRHLQPVPELHDGDIALGEANGDHDHLRLKPVPKRQPTPPTSRNNNRPTAGAHGSHPRAARKGSHDGPSTTPRQSHSTHASPGHNRAVAAAVASRAPPEGGSTNRALRTHDDAASPTDSGGAAGDLASLMLTDAEAASARRQPHPGRIRASDRRGGRGSTTARAEATPKLPAIAGAKPLATAGASTSRRR